MDGILRAATREEKGASLDRVCWTRQKAPGAWGAGVPVTEGPVT